MSERHDDDCPSGLPEHIADIEAGWTLRKPWKAADEDAAERSRMRLGAAEVARLSRSGLTLAEAATRLGVHVSTVQRWVALHRELFPPPRTGSPLRRRWADR